MRRLLLLLLIIYSATFYAKAQVYRDTDRSSVLNGVLHEKGTYNPVPGAKVAVKGTNVEIYADARGFFVIPDLGRGGDTWLQISAEDFETLEMPVTIGGINELGIIFMTPKQRDINPITVNDLRNAGSDVRNQTFSEFGTSALLLGTSDVLVNAANYNLGNLGFRLRGYEWENIDVYFNGMPINEPELGYASPMLWNGLNDAMTKAEGSYGLNSSLLYVSSVGGVSNMRIRPSEFRKRFKASYGFSNSLYNHNLSVNYTTGLMDDGLSILVAASGRLGNGFVNATSYKSASFLFVVEQELNREHSLMLTLLAAPTERGMQNYSVQEAYDMAGTNFYNSAWGFDNGSKRNARKNSLIQPLISLSHNWSINDWTLLRTTAGFTFGRNSETDLLWTSNVTDPRPDTYDKLSTTFTDPDKRQINWADMRTINTTGALVPQSQYIIGAQHSNRWMATLNSIYDNEISERVETTAGIQARYYKGSFYNEVNDLLSGRFWVDVDKFAAGTLVPPLYEQNNINSLNNEVKTGDRFAYDYNINQMDVELWNRWKISWRRWDFVASGGVSYTNFYRNGTLENGKSSIQSSGKSSSQQFININLKGGVSYPITINSRIEANAAFITRAPQFRNTFLIPQVGNLTADSIKNEKILSGELSYILSGAFYNLRVTGFYTQFNNQMRTRFYYDNDYQSMFSMSLMGLNQRHIGGEISADAKLTSQLTLNMGATYGIYKYTSNPHVTLIQQNLAKTLYQNVESQMNDLYVSGVPQIAATAGLFYDSPQNWWIGTNINFVSNGYAEMNPLRLTKEIIEKITPASIKFIGQEKLNSAFTFDVYGGYTFSFGDKYLGVNLNAHNLLNNKTAHIGGYEPLTVFDLSQSLEKYATRYVYAYGRTLFLIVSFRF